MKRGFTLVEILIAMTIGSLLILTLGELIVQGYKNYEITANQTTHVAVARRLQETIVRELREAVVSDRGDYPLAKAETNTLTFYSDVDKDAARERIRYWRDGSSLFRGVIEPTGSPPRYDEGAEETRRLGQYLTGTTPLFRYFDGERRELPIPPDLTTIQLVTLFFSIDTAPGKLPRATDIETLVDLRNIHTQQE